ncbi:esterase E4-like [Planococcus citri]|uniref:esterase E4-like n=1 Tax=Planococcus citri TaxID=170843 RepID=UPI0031FA151C
MVEHVVVTINEGRVRGVKETSRFSHVEYYAFYGIPYAQPPVDNLRFQRPKKVRPWKDVLDGRTPKGGCTQYSLYVFNFIGSEDCLYVNVFTPKLPKKDRTLKPVIAMIHPGGHQWGTPDPSDYGSPDFIMHHDIVYVTIGYRLHALGFLNLGLEECSGNQGLKDIIMGLEWIQSNIKFFNGDPNNVTLLGSSSGGSVIHFLMLSPAVRDGLFHKVVIMGHYIFNPSISFREEHLDVAESLAHRLNYTDEDKNYKKMLKFLKSVQYDKFAQIMKLYESKSDTTKAAIYPSGMFLPTVDHGKDAVLPASPRELMHDMKKIPMIFGICEKEAAIGFCKKLRPNTEKYFYSIWYQNPWAWSAKIDEKGRNYITQQVQSHYLNGQADSKIPISLAIDILTDAIFCDVYDSLLDLVSSELPVYVYKFQYDAECGGLKNRVFYLIQDHIDGAIHSDDFGYWALMHKPVKEKTVQVIEMFTKLICTFARTGDPNYENLGVHWRPTTPQEQCYLNIDDNIQLIEGKLNNDRMEFWNNLRTNVLKIKEN